MGTTRRMLSKLSIDFKLKLDNVPKGLHAPAQNFLAVGLGADAFAIVTWE